MISHGINLLPTSNIRAIQRKSNAKEKKTVHKINHAGAETEEVNRASILLTMTVPSANTKAINTTNGTKRRTIRTNSRATTTKANGNDIGKDRIPNMMTRRDFISFLARSFSFP